jgi:hypothetical protein
MIRLLTVAPALAGVLCFCPFAAASSVGDAADGTIGPPSPERVERVIDLPFEPIPIMVAGDPNGTPPDTPDDRLDANVPVSDWAGVASIFISHDGQYGYICTATPISPYHIMSAGHCFDENGNGDNDFGNNVWVIFNMDGYQSHLVTPDNIRDVHVHPDYTGFNNPNVNDDLVIIELIYPLPDGIPIYPVYRGHTDDALMIHTVGYGQSGDGVNGYYLGASFEHKRIGMNVIDAGWGDDEGGDLLEVYAFDFDGPMGNGFWGGPTLGNDLETTFGGGDSGGPSFTNVDGQWQIAAVNTFVFGWDYGGGYIIWQPYFGSGGGGIFVNAYLDWVDTIVRDWLDGDIDHDDDVDQSDLGLLLVSYEREPDDPFFDPRADLDQDGVVGQEDLGILLANYGMTWDG